MANVNRLGGFSPIKHLNGSPYNGAARLYEIVVGDGTAVNVGDLVKSDAGTATDNYPTCIRIAASGEVTSGLILGAVVGFVPDPTNLNVPQFRAASTKRFAWVADSPDLIFECADGSGTPVTLTQIGLNCGVQATAPNTTTTGTSQMTTGATAPTTTNTLPLKIMAITSSPDNTGGAANQRLQVMINQHYYMGGQTAT